MSLKLGTIMALGACAGFASAARAVEVYSLYGDGCAQTTGAVIDADDETATVLTLTGETKTVRIAGIKLVARYDVLQNPFPRVGPSPGGPPLLDVTSESSDGVFHAYATDFFEDLVLFLDDGGKIRVVQTDEIVSIRRDERRPAGKALKVAPVRLEQPPGRESCPMVTSSGTNAGPPRVATQVMADSLRVDSFWNRLKTGHRNLESLRERTLFYARPIMFDEKTRLGIIATRTNRQTVTGLAQAPLDSLPLYLEFGSGAAYRFQGSTSIGVKSWRMVPEVQPVAAIRSEFKSHLLHGMFLGNLSGLTAGKPLFTQLWQPDVGRDAPWVQASFNHLTLLGADYGPFSISYGYYFPSFALGQGREFREIVSTKLSPVGRLAYQKSGWQAELFLFVTDASGDIAQPADVGKADERDTSRFVRFYSERLIPESAHLTSKTARLDTGFLLPHELTAVADVVLTQTIYKEGALLRDTPLPADTPNTPSSSSSGTPTSTTAPTAPTGTDASSKLTQTLWATRLGLHMDLGKWVALGAEASFEHSDTSGGLAGSPGGRKTDQIWSYAAMMELLL